MLRPLTILFLAAAALAQQAETPDQLFSRAEKLRRDGKRDEAVAVYQQVILAQPDHVLAHKYYQEIMIALGHEKEILDYYQQLLASDPQKPLHHLLLGKLLSDEQALVEFQKCVELDPKFFWGHWALAGILLRTGKTDEAEKSARTALTITDNEYARTMLGAILAVKATSVKDKEKGKEVLREAAVELQRAIDQDKDYDPAYLALGKVLAMAEDYKTAIRALESGQKLNPSEPGFAQTLAQVYVENGKALENAAKTLANMSIKEQQAGKKDSAADVLGQAKVKAGAALLSFQKALEYAPEVATTREHLFAAHFLIANLALMDLAGSMVDGKYDEAAKCADAAIEEMKKVQAIEPANAKAKMGVAVSLLARANAALGQGKKLLDAGKKAEARKALEGALADAQASAATPDLDPKALAEARKLNTAILEALAKAKE